MFYYAFLFITSAALTAAGAYYTGIGNYVSEKYSRFRTLNRVVARTTKHKHACTVLVVSAWMVAQTLWIQFLQWINTSVVQLDKRSYSVSYVINGRVYKFVVAACKGPPHVKLVWDEYGEDVTDEVVPYMGPSNNWYGQNFSPDFWRRKTLMFHMTDGTVRPFHGNESILVH